MVGKHQLWTCHYSGMEIVYVNHNLCNNLAACELKWFCRGPLLLLPDCRFMRPLVILKCLSANITAQTRRVVCVCVCRCPLCLFVVWFSLIVPREIRSAGNISPFCFWKTASLFFDSLRLIVQLTAWFFVQQIVTEAWRATVHFVTGGERWHTARPQCVFVIPAHSKQTEVYLCVWNVTYFSWIDWTVVGWGWGVDGGGGGGEGGVWRQLQVCS